MTAVMPEPEANQALVGLFDPDNAIIPLVFERDDSYNTSDDRHWYGVADEVHYRWEEVTDLAEKKGQQVVRLYRADDPAMFRSETPAVIAETFNAGVEAAAQTIEKHAEAVGWYEGGGVWADAIEEARKAATR